MFSFIPLEIKIIAILIAFLIAIIETAYDAPYFLGIKKR